ncbi:MAG: hypothetical protein KDI51_18995, partial [Xanthomonadales bacterium]|nr:hypothetical protein [Xanthomonadales bacterium]
FGPRWFAVKAQRQIGLGLVLGAVAMPLGFFAGGVLNSEGDPSLGILLVPAGGVANVPLTVRAAAGIDTRSNRPAVTVRAEDDPQVYRTHYPAFLGPQDRK